MSVYGQYSHIRETHTVETEMNGDPLSVKNPINETPLSVDGMHFLKGYKATLTT